ncbi:hypothetical protein CTI14_66925, partial [Methylobacterium radiotolerans]
SPYALRVEVADDKTSVATTVDETVKLAFGGFVGVPAVKVDTVHAQAAPRPESPYALRVEVADDKTSVATTVDETVKLAFGGFV